MRKLLLLFVTIIISYSAKAAAGDTTIVQSHDTTWLSNYGNYDTTVKFPDGSKTYRKIYMTFTMGKYHCPGSPTYCGDWDYTVLTYLMTKTGDTVELARLISPYANASNARTPWTWQQHYVFDVTDFYPLLKDTATVRILYSGYSGGFTANVKFTFIEGTPERNVYKVKRLWHGSPGYGSSTNPINNSFTAIADTAPATTVSAAMRVLITGHGSDANGCCEFANHYYSVMLNGSAIDTTHIWRSDCGSNELYPQTGTWVFERGNWCPGALVNAHMHNLPGISGGSTYNVALNFEPYTVASPSGIYTTEAQLFYYGAINKTLDASLDDIIAPTSFEAYYRENPFCGMPRLVVRNTGSTAITSLKIQYGTTTPLQTYTWTGNIPPLQTTEVDLPETTDLRSRSGGTGNVTFTAQIMEVNGGADNDATNNSMSTDYIAAPQWPAKIIISLVTNKSSVGGVSETSWKLYELSNPSTPVAQRTNNAISTTYKDTLTLGPSCYKLVVEDAGCDGINWWLYSNPSAYPVNPGSGTIKVTTPTSIVAKTLTGYFNGDFGCGFTQYFTTLWPVGENTITNAEDITIDAFPNPVQKEVTISITGKQDVQGMLQIIDAMGRTVMSEKCTTTSQVLNLSSLPNGMYTVVFIDGKNENTKLQTRVIVAK